MGRLKKIFSLFFPKKSNNLDIYIDAFRHNHHQIALTAWIFLTLSLSLSLSLSVPIIHRSRQVLQITSCVRTEPMKINSS